MARNRRFGMLAGGLVVVAAIVIISGLGRQTPGSSVPSSNSWASRSGENGTHKTTDPAEAVKIGELQAPRPDPIEGGRNPFQFKPRAAPPPRPTPTTGRPGGPGLGGPAPGPTPAPPPSSPPMGLKFIGLVDAPAQGGKLAVLSDGRSVFYGHEGDVIDGRFKIVRIGVESIEMMYADGHGRQTIRLSGQ